MYGWMHALIDGWMDELMHRWMVGLFDNKTGSKFLQGGFGTHELIDEWIDGWIDG
jgi:hypothetical protein